MNLLRVIPVLLIDNGSIVNTERFRRRHYIGDPLNTVNLFNDFEVDELIVLDINASKNDQIDYLLLEEIAGESFMPMSYGGGIKSIEEIEKILSIGFEKVILGSAAFLNPDLVRNAARIFGSQAIVASVDVTRSITHKYRIRYLNGSRKNIYAIDDYIKLLEDCGVGEILINCIHRDGTMKGYDDVLINIVSRMTTVPLIILGGARSSACIKSMHAEHHISAAASSIFVYKENTKSVLINFPAKVLG